MLCVIRRISSFDRKYRPLSQICAKTAWNSDKILCESEDFVGAWLPGSRLKSNPAYKYRNIVFRIGHLSLPVIGQQSSLASVYISGVIRIWTTLEKLKFWWHLPPPPHDQYWRKKLELTLFWNCCSPSEPCWKTGTIFFRNKISFKWHIPILNAFFRLVNIMVRVRILAQNPLLPKWITQYLNAPYCIVLCGYPRWSRRKVVD